jgi:hypothetical protein
MVRWRAASCRACIMLSTRSLSRCLHNGYHNCKEANILNTESEARRGKTLSITILLRVVYKVQDIVANMNQKRRCLVPVWFPWVSRNSPRSRACHAGPRASWTKLHRNRAAGQVNIMWIPVAFLWRPVDERDYSSAFPGNGARKYALCVVNNQPFGNPKRKV